MRESATNENFSTAPELSICDRIQELGLNDYDEEDKHFYDELKLKDISFYFNKKNIDETIAKRFLPDIADRIMKSEKRIKQIENLLWKLPREENSPEEDRFERLSDLLDKVCQGFDIWDEHVTKRIPYSHRVVLEARLCHLINSIFDIIEKICQQFDVLKNDPEGVENERQWLNCERQLCNQKFSELHENFLKSYLGIEW